MKINKHFASDELKNLNPDNYKFYGLWKQKLFSASFWVDNFKEDIAKKDWIKLRRVWILYAY